MTVFNKKRIQKDMFELDYETIDKIRKGHFSDDYFKNTTKILETLSKEGYKFGLNDNNLNDITNVEDINIGDIHVEMQIFTSRYGKSLIVGLDEVLNILKAATGYFENENFINTFDKLEVEALHDGDITTFNGDKENIEPVMKIRGKYRDFGYLETLILGVLSEPTRIATNVYNLLIEAKGKPILFFPARFSHYYTQRVHGYAYYVATERYNYDFSMKLKPYVSTLEQGTLWGGSPTGTIAHSTIATFLGNVTETMIQYCRIIDPNRPRIALIDFHNNCVEDGIKVLDKMWEKYWYFIKNENKKEAKKYKLYGVRPDTSSNLIDKSLAGEDKEYLMLNINIIYLKYKF